MVGRMGSGRKTSTTPSTTSRAFAVSRMLLVDPLLHAEAEADPHAPRVDRPVLDHGGDARDLGRPDAVDRRRSAGHGESDRVLDRVRRGSGERDRLLDHGCSPPVAAPPPCVTIGLDASGNASYGVAVRVGLIAVPLRALATAASAAREPDAAGRFAV